ncbi:MAG: hypothetical protein FJ319_01135 [SAR202 cluster bacterium]|nr:hypothetical protein [SAR202 cluster bacterium]
MLLKEKKLVAKLSLANDSYWLGETMDLAVTLDSYEDLDIREGRIDLICQEESTDGSFESGEPRKVYVHSTIVFLRNERLAAGDTRVYTPRLPIKRTPPVNYRPTRGIDGRRAWSFRWKVVALFDVSTGRDIRTQKTVQVFV